MANIVKFTGKTPGDHKTLYGCNDCDSRSFKIMTYGESDGIVVRCSNCEAVQNINVQIPHV